MTNPAPAPQPFNCPKHGIRAWVFDPAIKPYGTASYCTICREEEAVTAALQAQRDRADQKIDELNLRLLGARRERDELRARVSDLQKQNAIRLEMNHKLVKLHDDMRRERDEAREKLAEKMAPLRDEKTLTQCQVFGCREDGIDRFQVNSGEIALLVILCAKHAARLEVL